MTMSMDNVDRMMKDAEVDQKQAEEQLVEAESFPITGIQLNESSRMVTIYHRETGEPRTMPRISAKMALAKKYRQHSNPLFGQYIFSGTPTKTYYQGEQKCYLHPDSDKRAQFDRWGLPVCTSEHLASPGEARRHMELRHPSAWKIYQEEETKLRHQQEIESSHALATAVLEALSGMQPEKEQPVKAAKKVTADT